MNVPSLHFDGSMETYLLSQGAALIISVVYLSFFEWALHRNIMHRKTWISYPFRTHALVHHDLFRHDDSFHLRHPSDRKHIRFSPRDYVLLVLVNTPVFLVIEILLGSPIILGCWGASLAYLAAFDTLHWMFHVPKNRFFERWGWYRWLKLHHRLHHRYHYANLNVVIPIADFVLGTRVRDWHRPWTRAIRRKMGHSP
jgi:hypothetical protein